LSHTSVDSSFNGAVKKFLNSSCWAVTKQEQFEALCKIIGNPALVQDPRFADRKNRLANRPALTAELEAAFATAPTLEWVKN
jgi:crotonobetainyl-CoA:carnitine CoA-transferase CaiB-like acyl-CoA transferase